MYNIIISYHLPIYKEEKLLIKLFDSGLQRYHLRKHGFSINDYKVFLEKIPSKFHNRIVLHEHFELLNEFDLLGYYVPTALKEDFNSKNISINNNKFISSSFATSIQELHELDGKYDYLIMGPIFKSISKPNLALKYSHDDLALLFKTNNFKSKIIAIGGIKEDTTEMALNYGFDGVAMLGIIWAKYMETFRIEDAVERYKSINSVVSMMYN